VRCARSQGEEKKQIPCCACRVAGRLGTTALESGKQNRQALLFVIEGFAVGAHLDF
jgi:hypothetical protein